MLNRHACSDIVRFLMHYLQSIESQLCSINWIEHANEQYSPQNLYNIHTANILQKCKLNGGVRSFGLDNISKHNICLDVI